MLYKNASPLRNVFCARSWLIAVASGSLLAGIVTGWLGASRLPPQNVAEVSQALKNLLTIYEAASQTKGLFREAVINQGLSLLKTLLLGTSVIGMPLIMAFVFSRGLRLGYTIGIILSSFPLNKGFLLVLAGVLPHNLLNIPLCIGTACLSANLSLDILYRLKNGPVGFDLIRFNTGRCLFLLLLTALAAALLEGFLSPFLICLLVPSN